MPSTPPSALNDKQSPSSHLPPSLPNSPIAKRPKTRLMSANDPTAPLSSSTPTIPPVTAEPPLRVKFLSDKAKAPTRGSAFAAGYDLYAAEHCAIPAKGKALVGTSLAIVVPGGCCRYLGLCDQTFYSPRANEPQRFFGEQKLISSFNRWQSCPSKWTCGQKLY